MAFPSEKDMEIPILQEIEKAGGQVRRKDIIFYQRVASHFPQLTPEDLNEKLSGGENKWKNKVEFVFRRLVKDKEELEIPERGTLSITNRGRLRLGEGEVVTARRIEVIKERVSEAPSGILLQRAKEAKGEPTRLTHNELVQKIKEMGEMLGKVTEPVVGVPYKHDCVWKDNPWANPKLVVEVCDKGILDKDIASLDWAVTSWGAKGILVIFDAADFQSAQKKLAQKSQIYPIKAEDILKLHSLLQAGNIKAVRSIFAA
jgi:hypothetical protein